MVAPSVLVAGGSGFLGSHLCETLVEDGRDVFCVDNFGSGRRRNVEHLMDHPRFTLLEADIREGVSLPATDEIYHLASRASPTDFTEFPVNIALTNTEGTHHLLDQAVKYDSKLVFASTSEVYGDPEVHPQPETYTGNVNIRGSRGCYDESKRFGETLTVVYENTFDLDVRTARIFNTYGPRMRPNDGRVVPTFLAQALVGEDLTVYGSGTQTRSFCYVTDLIEGLRALMDTDGLQGKVVNIGRTNERTVRELAEITLDICETDSEIIHEPLPEDDPQRRCPDTTRATELLGWEATTPLHDGLRRTADHIASVLDDGLTV
jgi:UDP-glucuronate decarboxylase